MGEIALTVSTHFCGGRAVEPVLAIGNQDVDCGMMDMKQERTNTQDGKTPCCDNHFTVYEVEDDYSAEANPIDANDRQ